MKHLSTIVILSAIFTSNAQKSTFIEYNCQNESYKFFKVKSNGDTVQVKKPFAYKDIPTTVVVKDVNTFYYTIGFEAEHTMNQPIGSDQSMEMLSENFTAGYNAFSDMIGEVKQSDIYGSLFTNGQFNGLDGIMSLAGGHGAGEAQELSLQKDMLYSKMDALEDEQDELYEEQSNLNRKSASMSTTFKDLIKIEFVNDQLYKLMNNRDVSPAEMKSRAEELILLVYNNSTPSIADVAQESETAVSSLSNGYNDYMTNFRKYEAHHSVVLDSLNAVKSRLTYSQLISEVDKVISDLKFDYEGYFNNVDALNTLMQQYNTTEVRDQYLKAFEMYDKILHADFDLEYSLNTDMDVTTLTMSFMESDTSSGEVLKTRKLNIPTVGGLRINSSAGIAFLRYAAGHHSYSSESGFVTEQQGDAFIPALTTMFHFYRQTYRPVSFGGSFGFGIPTEGDKNFIYMLGGSTIFGKSQRVILNFGAFGGKIAKLDGVNVGDNYPTGTIVPTKLVFDFGAYLALTLNINKMF